MKVTPSRAMSKSKKKVSLMHKMRTLEARSRQTFGSRGSKLPRYLTNDVAVEAQILVLYYH